MSAVSRAAGSAARLPPGARQLYSAAEIRACVARLGRDIGAVYGDEDVTLVAVLHGGLLFAADLLRELTMPVRLAVVQASSYRGEATQPGALTVHVSPGLDVRDRHVLLVDDILDTGRTLSRLRAELGALEPRSLRTAVLLDKPSRRNVPIEADFRGFEIPDLFVVGYGLDWNERYRNLPDILAVPASPTS